MSARRGRSLSNREDFISSLRGCRPRREERPPYLGASVVGHPCEAYLAFARLSKMDEATPREERIFELGHILEDVMVEHVGRCGYIIVNRQQEVVAYGGELKTHIDGVIVVGGEPGLAEFKSMNASEFAKFVKHGSSEFPRYRRQCMAMMGMTGYTWTALIAYCKNNSDYHVEFIDFDEFEWARIRQHIENAMSGRAKRIGKDQSFWICKTCRIRERCWKNPKLPWES